MSRIDSKFQALRDQGFTGTLSDMTLQWLQQHGATSNSISDAWREMLLFQGYTGQRNDAWFQLLSDRGYDGAYPDREAAFWADGGIIGPPPEAKTVWVRPFGEDYGDSSGDSYENALSGWEALNWDDINVGDTIALAGTHIKTVTGSTPVGGNYWQILKNNVTVDGGLNPDDPAVVWGAYDDQRGSAPDPGTWVLAPGSTTVYENTGALNFTTGAYRNIDGIDHEILVPPNIKFTDGGAGPATDQEAIDALEAMDVTDRGGFWNSREGSGKCFMRPSAAGGAPVAEDAWYSGGLFGYGLRDRRSVRGTTWKNFAFMAETFAREYVPPDDDMNYIYDYYFSYLTLENLYCDLGFSEYAYGGGPKAWMVTNGIGQVTDLNIIDCTFRRMPAGIYFEVHGNGPDQGPPGSIRHQECTNFVCTGTTFEDISTYYMSLDGNTSETAGQDVHCLGFQHLKDSVIQGCTFQRTNNGIAYHPWKSRDYGDVVVDKCLFKDIQMNEYRGPVTHAIAIAYEGAWLDSPQDDEWEGVTHTFSTNVFENCDRKAMHIGSGRGRNDIYNNTFTNCANNEGPDSNGGTFIFEQRWQSGTTGADLYFHNNIFDTNCNKMMNIALQSPLDNIPYTVSFNNNAYDAAANIIYTNHNYPSYNGTPGEDWVDFLTNTAPNDDTTVIDTDDLSVTGNIDIDTTSDAPNRYVPSGTSPVIDLATDTVLPPDYTDFYGNPMESDAWDSGACEGVKSDASDTPEALAVVERLKTESGDPDMDAGEERAILDFVNAIVNGGLWAGIDEIFCLGLSEQYSLIGFKEDTLSKALSGSWSLEHKSRVGGWWQQYGPGLASDTLRSGLPVSGYANNNFVEGDAFYTFMYSQEGGWSPVANANNRPFGSSTGNPPDVAGTPSDTIKLFDLTAIASEGQNYSDWYINNGLYKIGAYTGDHSLGLYPDAVFTCYDSGTGTLPTVTKDGVQFGAPDGDASVVTGTRDDAHIELMGWPGATNHISSAFFFAIGKHTAMGDYSVWNAACSQLLADLRALP